MVTLLATVEGLAERAGRAFDPTDVKAITAIEDASALIRAWTHQELSFVPEDRVVLDGPGSQGLLLPEVPAIEICEVSTLANDGTPTVLDPTAYRVLEGAAVLWRMDRLCWPLGHGNVVVSYDHGYETIPDDIVAACLQVAGRLYQSASGNAGALVSAEAMTIGAASRSVDYDTSTAGSVDETGLTGLEKASISKYRMKW